jgi:RNA polymerase sigma factor (sigma-70 family)
MMMGPELIALRESAGPLIGKLARRFHDFALAEDAVQEALVEAMSSWPRTGVPTDPTAWLWTAARANALDAIRSDARRRNREAEHPPPAAADLLSTDDRLGLLFGCCHPALALESRLALTLRAVVGLTTPQIARAFMLSEATLAQRIVRAKRKIAATHIQLEVPDLNTSPSRLNDVLTVIWLMFNEAYVSTTGTHQDRDLAADALWLADTVAVGLPREAEAWGLAALLSYHHARATARFGVSGELIVLARQDRSLWNQALIAQAEIKLERAASLQAPGPYQLQAAIAGCHSSAGSWQETDWLQIVLLYDMLAAFDSSPVVILNRAVARAHLAGPESVLPQVEALSQQLDSYHLFHAVYAELLRMAGRSEEADIANRRALTLTANSAERRLLRTRLRRGALEDGY